MKITELGIGMQAKEEKHTAEMELPEAALQAKEGARSLKLEDQLLEHEHQLSWNNESQRSRFEEE